MNPPAAPVLDPALVHAARRWARYYHGRGYQPLPSRPPVAGLVERKRPLCRYGEWWEGGGPDPDWLWDRFPTTNIQLVTGRHWRLAVIDLDGAEAVEAWSSLRPASAGPLPRTWESTSGGGGRHIWYTLPDGLPSTPKRVLWRGEGGHRAIELLCDRCLVMAPPSIHPATGRPYRFRPGRSPRELTYPAPMPRWVLDLPSADRPRPVVVPPPAIRAVRKAPGKPLPRGVGRRDVLDAIHDKTTLVRSWGLRIASDRPNGSGWLRCHDYDRADVHPSAGFCPATGRFWRPGERSKSLFDLGVELGHYADWRHCLADLAAIYLYRSGGRTCDGTAAG